MPPAPLSRAGGRCASLFDIVDRKSAGAGSAGALVIANVTCKMSAMKVREAIRLIEEDGWYLVATRGSHRQYKHPSKPGRVTIAGKPSDDLAPGTRNSIMKQAKLKEPR